VISLSLPPNRPSKCPSSQNEREHQSTLLKIVEHDANMHLAVMKKIIQCHQDTSWSDLWQPAVCKQFLAKNELTELAGTKHFYLAGWQRTASNGLAHALLCYKGQTSMTMLTTEVKVISHSLKKKKMQLLSSFDSLVL